MMMCSVVDMQARLTLDRVRVVVLSILVASLTASVAAVAAEPAFGINLAGPADWNSELPFVDVFRMSRPWISQREGAAWGKGPELDLDKRGYVRRLELGCYAESIVCTIDGNHYPSGIYTMFFEGTGEIEPAGAATRVVSTKSKDGVTRILFARPTTVAEGSPGIAVVQEIEDVITTALQTAVAAAEGR